jgi:hypothetical protein
LRVEVRTNTRAVVGIPPSLTKDKARAWANGRRGEGGEMQIGRTKKAN